MFGFHQRKGVPMRIEQTTNKEDQLLATLSREARRSEECAERVRLVVDAVLMRRAIKRRTEAVNCD